MKKILFILFVTVFFSGCEKDDICDENTSTTPLLVLEFFEVANPTIPKNITDLAIIGLEPTLGTITYNGVNKIQLPLRLNADMTKFSLTNKSKTANELNTVIMQINYSRKDTYVSRACGYKTSFVLNESSPITISDETPADFSWISQNNISIVTSNIENSNETHVKVFF